MLDSPGREPNPSPFHLGEQQVQETLGVRDQVERFGRRVIRNYLTDQHREFYSQLPFLSIGHVDAQGRPWASIVAGKPGFIHAPHPGRLCVRARPFVGDPLALAPHHSALGLLGLEPASRRRNRLNGIMQCNDATGFEVAVQQSFGNCPQHIHARSVHFAQRPSTAQAVAPTEWLTGFDSEAQQLIRSSDTFFVASATPGAQTPRAEREAILGADVSHRGGLPGFVGVQDNTCLVVPDFAGNHHYNTLGNFVVNPRAGLLFVDFDSGTLLMLTGQVEIVWDGPEVDSFQGAMRLWKFRLTAGLRLRSCLPLRALAGELSPSSRLTGTWAESQKRLNATTSHSL